MGKLALVVAAGLAAAAVWWRRHPSACPYSQRLWVQAPHPFITRERLREVLAPAAGERILEVGSGTGYYTLDLAGWVGPQGAVEILDIQQEMLDHTMRRAAEAGLANLEPTCADAASLPYEDGSFDAVVLITTLGEIPNRDSAMAEIARVLRPGGRLVVGELFGDPHYTSPGALRAAGEAAGLRFDRRSGPAFGYFGRLLK
jgi:ubiquinone/menaquinone biosynthesis C-methylase UbiE